jgi:hypothetical protein
VTDLPRLKLSFPDEAAVVTPGPRTALTDNDIPDLKLKTQVSFPAGVIGGTAVDVVQSNGIYQFNINHGELAQIASVPAIAIATTYLVLWESTQNTYRRISLTDFKAQLASMP